MTFCALISRLWFFTKAFIVFRIISTTGVKISYFNLRSKKYYSVEGKLFLPTYRMAILVNAS